MNSIYNNTMEGHPGIYNNNFDDEYHPRNSKVTLMNKSLWKQFHDLQTEMIITRSGRRMFPSLHVQVEDLDPNAQYCVLLEMTPATRCRYKYSTSVGWTAAGTEEAQSPHRIFMHPESPATGEFWMSQHISFGRIKLTNSVNPTPGHVILSSMHKYQPKIIIVKTSDPRAVAWAPSTSVVFPETQFIAVTAYQNEKITKLKIDHNPFAKGFRENGQSKTKRKRLQSEGKVEEAELSVKKRALESPKSEDDSHTSRVSPSASVSPPVHPRSPYPTVGYNYMYPYYYHQYQYPAMFPSMWNASHYYYPQPVLLAEDLTLQKVEVPRKLTDFSIRAITGQS